MELRTIAISQANYEILQNFGKAGMSFNDVISGLITKVSTMNEPCLDDKVKKKRSDRRPGNQGQTLLSTSPRENDEHE